MKHMKRLGGWALLVLAALALVGCGSAFHNGTEMVIKSITVTGLPANPFAPGQQLAFSYQDGGGNWTHGTTSLMKDPEYMSTVSANGTWSHTFPTPLLITTGQLTFLLIDPTENWGEFQVDNRVVTGTSYNNVVMPNNWQTSGVNIVGQVYNGTYVKWSYQ